MTQTWRAAGRGTAPLRPGGGGSVTHTGERSGAGRRIRTVCPNVNTPIFDELAAVYLADLPDSRERLSALAASSVPAQPAAAESAPEGVGAGRS
jgi:hypothetical protein